MKVVDVDQSVWIFFFSESFTITTCNSEANIKKPTSKNLAASFVLGKEDEWLKQSKTIQIEKQIHIVTISRVSWTLVLEQNSFKTNIAQSDFFFLFLLKHTIKIGTVSRYKRYLNKITTFEGLFYLPISWYLTLDTKL